MKIIDFKDCLHWKLFDYLRNRGFQIASDRGIVHNEYRPSVYLGLVLPDDEQVNALKRLFRLQAPRVFLGVIYPEYSENGLLFKLHDRGYLSMAESLCLGFEEVFKIQTTISIIPDGRRVEIRAHDIR